jgi:hypothetical protein
MLGRTASITALEVPTLAAQPEAAAEPTKAPRAMAAWRHVASRLGWRAAAIPNAGRLCAARADFMAALSDVPAPDCRELCHLLRHAQSHGELWHLRPEVYRTLALHHTQAEAEKRIDALNRCLDGMT